MNWIEILLIIAGVSLDIFAAMECHGSLVKQVNKKHLSIICVVMAAGQFITLNVGFFLSDYYCRINPPENETFLGEAISVAILMCLGGRLIVKAVKNELVDEHLLLDFHLGKFFKLALFTSAYTMLAGMAFGFLHTNLIIVLGLMIVFTILCIIAGIYTGYHFGFEQKTKAYIVGAILLWIAGTDVVVRHILHLI